MVWKYDGPAATMRVSGTLENLNTGSTASVELQGAAPFVAFVRLYCNPDATFGQDEIGGFLSASSGASARNKYLFMDSDTYAASSSDPTFEYPVSLGGDVFATGIEIERSMKGWIVPYINDYDAFDPSTGAGIGHNTATSGRPSTGLEPDDTATIKMDEDAGEEDEHFEPMVTYLHPCVVALDDGDLGYLMILTRRRSPTNLVKGTGDGAATGSAEEIISDIVAWHSEDAAFDEASLRGPVLLVSSLDATPGQTARMWLGVAGAVERVVEIALDNATQNAARSGRDSDRRRVTRAEDPSVDFDPDVDDSVVLSSRKLFLYYAIEFGVTPAVLKEDTDDYVHKLVDWVDAELAEYVNLMFPDGTLEAAEDYSSLLDGMSKAPMLGTRTTRALRAAALQGHGGIALKTFDVDDILGAFDALEAAGDGSERAEENWEWSSATGSPAVDGDLKGWARVWIAVEPSEADMVTSFYRMFPAQDVTSLKNDAVPPGEPTTTSYETNFKPIFKGPTDPAPGMCGDGTLSLYFSVIEHGPNDFENGYLDEDGVTPVFDGMSGHGIWRGAAVSGGERLVVAPHAWATFLTTSTITCEYGLDFLVSRIGSATITDGVDSAELLTSESLVARSIGQDSDASGILSWYGKYVDPDALGTRDGVWRVYSSGTQSGSPPDVVLSLDVFEGKPGGTSTESPGCRSWEDAWDAPPDTVEEGEWRV